MRLGPTKKFPRGKLNAGDEGELRLAIYHRDKTVILDFGTEVRWIGLDATGARRLAATIIQHADDVEKGL